MRRYLLITVLIFTTFALEGCRRMRDTPREPVKVLTENDFLINRSKELMAKIGPKKVWPLELTSTVKDFPDDPDIAVKWPDTPGEDDAKKLDALQKIYDQWKDDKLQERRQKYLTELSDLYFKFYDSVEDKPRLRTTDNFRQFVRRADQPALMLYRLLDTNAVTPVMEADLSSKAGQIILYYNESIKEANAYALAIGQKVKTPLDKLPAIQAQVNAQKFRAIYVAYREYLQSDDRDYDSLKAHFAKNAVGSLVEAHAKGDFKLMDPTKIGKGTLKVPVPIAAMKDADASKGYVVMFYKSPKDKGPAFGNIPDPLPGDFK